MAAARPSRTVLGFVPSDRLIIDRPHDVDIAALRYWSQWHAVTESPFYGAGATTEAIEVTLAVGVLCASVRQFRASPGAPLGSHD
jgi:hypothetical protein